MAFYYKSSSNDFSKSDSRDEVPDQFQGAIASDY